jgi:hypothetical protein
MSKVKTAPKQKRRKKLTEDEVYELLKGCKHIEYIEQWGHGELHYPPGCPFDIDKILAHAEDVFGPGVKQVWVHVGTMTRYEKDDDGNWEEPWRRFKREQAARARNQAATAGE